MRKVTPLQFVEILKNYQAIARTMDYEIDFTLPLSGDNEPAPADRRMFSKGELRGWLQARADQMKPNDILSRADIYATAGWGIDGSAYVLLGHDSARGLHSWLGRRATDVKLVGTNNSLGYMKPEPLKL